MIRLLEVYTPSSLLSSGISCFLQKMPVFLPQLPLGCCCIKKQGKGPAFSADSLALLYLCFFIP